MSTFTPRVTPTSAALDPLKHVNYNLGMVLGVDDFTQEFSYLSGHDHWLARDLLGYGTVSGLRVFTENDAKGPRVVVEPGAALSPHGQLIRVPTAQCAYLNDWLKLETTKKQLLAHVVSPPSTLRVYVVLCYRDCPTDKVPIPGEPCRSEDDVMLPSRLMDDFRLELMLEPPGQREEDAVRDFVAWLSQVPVSKSSASSSLNDFLNALRTAARVLTSPPEAGSGPLADYMFDSPPGSLVINAADLCDYLDAAFRLWVTELRPKWRPDFFAGVHGTSIDKGSSIGRTEECLLLAEVDVPAIIPAGGVDWVVKDPALIRVDEERRPIVVHLRMLQEMLLCGNREQFLGSPPAGGGGPSIPGSPITPGGNVSDGTTFGAARNAGRSANFSRADHSHGTPSDAVAGDVTGTFNRTTVAAIRNAPVVGTPADGQVLTFRNNQWQAETPARGGAADVVEHPAGLPKYSIVAAGIVKCDGSVRRPVYGGLIATATAPSVVSVRFDGLLVPDGRFQYVVKAMPVSNDSVGITFVSFGAFSRAGDLTLKVERLNFQNIRLFTIPIDELKLMELMIEVSRFEA